MKTVTRTVLIADEGMLLTDGKTFCKEAYLGEGADASVWREVAKKEYDAIQAENEEINAD